MVLMAIRDALYRPKGRNEEVIRFMLWKLLRVCCLLHLVHQICSKFSFSRPPPSASLSPGPDVCVVPWNERQLSCRSPTALRLEWFRDTTGSQFVLKGLNLCSCAPICSLYPAFLRICSCARPIVTLGSTQMKNQQPAQTVLPVFFF